MLRDDETSLRLAPCPLLWRRQNPRPTGDGGDRAELTQGRKQNHPQPANPRNRKTKHSNALCPLKTQRTKTNNQIPENHKFRNVTQTSYVANGDFGLDLSIGRPISPAEDPEGSRLAIEEVDAALFAGLDLAWAEQETRAAQFKTYRETPSEVRQALLAYVVVSTLHPSIHDPSGRPLRALWILRHFQTSARPGRRM